MAPPKSTDDLNDEAAKDELEPGHTLMHGQYTIEGFLNAGGFGITYLAKNSLDRTVVIKECFPASHCRRSETSVRPRSRSHTKEYSSIVKRFVDEAHSLAKVKHPNVVGVHEVFEDNKTAYMVLDFIEGPDLLDIIEGKKEKPTPTQIEAMLKKLLDALGYIHGLDMLHRDISPDNILLNSAMEPILIDFGAVREDVAQKDRALSELRVVKDGYSPQEFYVSGAKQGAYSDLYALAATFYHLIVGEIPVDAQKRLAAVAGAGADPYQPLVGRVSEYSEPFLQGIDTALNMIPKDRFESAEQWLALLSGSETTPIRALTVVTKPLPRSVPDVKKKSRVLAALGLAIPVIGGAAYLYFNNDGTPPAEIAATSTTVEASPSVAEAAPELEAVPVPVPSDTAASSPDLAAALNIAAVDADAAANLGPADNASPFGDLGAALNLSDVAPSSNTTAPQAPAVTSSNQTASSPSLDASVTTDIAPAAGAPELPTEEVGTLSEDVALLPSAAEAPSEILDVEPETNIERFDLPQVTSAWSVDLAGLPVNTWGTVYSVNGLPLGNDVPFEASLHEMLPAPAEGTIELSILAGDSEDTAVLETITVPVIHETSFIDGLTFETRMIDGNWTTDVANAPAGSNFQIDDIVVGDLSREIEFDSRTSLPDALIYADVNDLSALTIVVRRDGNMSVISLPVPR